MVRVRTLDAQHLSQLEGRSTHLGEFRDESFHVSRAEHQRPGALGLASGNSPQTLANGAKGHGGGQSTILP